MELACLASLGFALLMLGAGILLWERRQRAMSPAPTDSDPDADPLTGPQIVPSTTTHLIGDPAAAPAPRQLSFLDVTQPNPPRAFGRTWRLPPLPSIPRLPKKQQTRPGARPARTSAQTRPLLLLGGFSLSVFACAVTLALAPWGAGQAQARGVTIGIAPFAVPAGAAQPSAPLGEYIMQAISLGGYSEVSLRTMGSSPTDEASAETLRSSMGADFLIWGEIGAGGEVTANVALHPHFAPGQRQWQLYTDLHTGALVLPQHSCIFLPASQGTDPLVPLASALVALRLKDYEGAAAYGTGARATLGEGGGTGNLPALVEASAFAAAGEHERAIALFDTLDAEGRLTPEGATNRALSRLMRSDWGGAIGDAERVLGDREAPDRVTARAYLVRAWAHMGAGSGYGLAIADLDEAARLDPAYRLYRLSKAEAFYRQAQPDSARAELSTLTGQMWDAAPAYRLAGLTRLMLGQPDEAFPPLNRAYELYNAWIGEMRGVEAAAQVAGDAREAGAATESILRLNRELATVRLYSGMTWADKAKGEPEESFLGAVWRNIRSEPTTYERAIRDLEEAAKLDPARADVPLQMGNVYIAMGDPTRGAEALARARTLDPTRPEPYLATARLQESQRNPQEALATLGQLTANNPHYYAAYWEMHRLYAGLGDVAKANDALAAGLEVAPRVPADHLWRGKFLRTLGRIGEAQEAFSAALADPDLWEAHLNLGELWQEAGRLPDALAAYKLALERQPNEPRALLGAGRLLVLAGETAEAEKLFSRLTTLAPRNVDGHIASLQLYVQKGDLDAALESGKRAVEAEPSRTDAHFYLGAAHEARGEWTQAEGAYKAATDRDPNNVGALKGRAQALIRLDRPAEGLEVAAKAAELASTDPQAHKLLAQARIAVGDLAGGLEALSRALELQPGWAEALSLASRSYLLGGDRDAALLYANRAVESAPRDPAGYLAQGDALLAGGLYREAIASFDMALGVAPGSGAAQVGKGRAQAGMADHSAALQTYEQALGADGNNPEAWLHSARSYEAIGNLEEAHRRYARAVELRPLWAEALSDLGRSYLTRGDGRAALGVYERATKSAPNMAGAWRGFGLALRREGRLPEATEALMEATRLDPNDAEAWLNLGLTLEERGDRVSAHKAYTTALERAMGDGVRQQAQSGLERVK